MAKVFISYSRKDIDFAKRLTAELQKSDLDFWIDWEGIPPTVDWWKEIEKGIEEADIFLFLLSPDSVTSQVCLQEIESAVRNGKRLIPVVARDIHSQDAPAAIKHLNYIFFREQDDFSSALSKLLTAIHMDYDWVQVQRRLQVKALEWERNHRESSFLLRGKDLQDAEAQLNVNSEKEPRPTSLQFEYVAQSTREQAEERKRQQEKDQQIELEKKLAHRLQRLSYVLIGVFTIAFVALFLWLNTVVRNLAINSVRDQMLAIAETGVSFIDGDEYERLLDSYDEFDEAVLQDEYYLWIARVVDAIVSSNANIDREMGVYFVAPAAGENQVLAVYTDYEHFKSSWDVESDSVLLTGQRGTTATTTEFTDGFGTWVSACTPILNAEEISVGALCVDLDASLVTEARRHATTTLLIAFLAIYPAMIAAVFLTTRSISKQRVGRR